MNQINKANQDSLVDVLIVGRGGGSIEDLWAFNERVVAEAIYASKNTYHICSGGMKQILPLVILFLI